MAPAPLSQEQEDLIWQLIYLMRDTPPLSRADAQSKQEAIYGRKGKGTKKGWRDPGLPAALRKPRPNPAEHVRNISALTDLTIADFGLWIEYGEPMPVFAAERLWLSIRQRELLTLERAYLALLIHHFGQLWPTQWPIVQRAIELSVYFNWNNTPIKSGSR